jgi:UDPglucose 6-dehydrogenase
MRESPAIEIIEVLQDAGVAVTAFDPEGIKEAQKLFTGVEYAADPYAACGGSDVIVLVTEWDMFRTLDLSRLHAAVRTANLVDLRNVFDAEAAAAAGFSYQSIGKAPVAPTAANAQT